MRRMELVISLLTVASVFLSGAMFLHLQRIRNLEERIRELEARPLVREAEPEARARVLPFKGPKGFGAQHTQVLEDWEPPTSL